MTMQNHDPLEPVSPPDEPSAARAGISTGKAKFLAAGGFAAAGMAAALAGVSGQMDLRMFGARDVPNAASDATRKKLREVAIMTVDDKSQIIVEGLDAKERNAGVPVSSLPLEKLGGFQFGNAGKEARATALKCLTQAVYYEAANEPLDGRRAVAQVVLNRLHHPAYPKSVCGVVYEGSQRRTGCQFSFTCDGSLLRRPAARPWREAEEIAKAALAGHVEASVGTATHYHADYVLPKWAFTLGKIGQHGRHIFYRFTGGWGRSSAFTARYNGIERIPAIDFAALRERADADLIAAQDFVPGLTVTPHVTDRHAENDVGGRIDVTKQWRLSIPDPTQATSRYRAAVEETVLPEAEARHVAVAEQARPVSAQ